MFDTYRSPQPTPDALSRGTLSPVTWVGLTPTQCCFTNALAPLKKGRQKAVSPVGGVGFRPRSPLNGGNPRTGLLFAKLANPKGVDFPPALLPWVQRFDMLHG
jgi:hypothetical protein